MSASRFSFTRQEFTSGGCPVHFYSLPSLAEQGLGDTARLPLSIRVLLESVLRNQNHAAVEDSHIEALIQWGKSSSEIPFIPGRVVLQDFTGVPCVVDLAALRSAMQRAGKDPKRIEPLVPVDLVIDHSIQVDKAGSADAVAENTRLEFQRNRERYEFLRWGQGAFRTLSITPPAVGIVHQVNLEYLAKVVLTSEQSGALAYPDSLVGTDSHTTMINGLGIVGWGVGGIEAEACMLGQPIFIPAPEVVGFRLSGRLPDGVTATDLTLTIVQQLRRYGVVGKFVEFFGAGLDHLPLADRATIANMAPEYGATIGFFPVDQESLDYLRITGRSEEQIALVEDYYRAQGMFRTAESPEPVFSDVLELDLGSVEPSLAGPRRPHDRISLGRVAQEFTESLRKPVSEEGFAAENPDQQVTIAELGGARLRHGSVVIAAITSCTNTSNPSVMVAAGLVAKKAVERGLRVASTVKTSLAPGSRVVTGYLKKAGLEEPLNQLGFHTVGYGCTTCIGNSGPLHPAVEQSILDNGLVVSAVLSGNRNFEGRVHPQTKANYLASPPLVVAYALAGNIDVNLESDPLGKDKDGQPVYFRDIWPSSAEVAQAMTLANDPNLYRSDYQNVATSNPDWNAIEADDASSVYDWKPESTYIQEPPFFVDFTERVQPIVPILGARALLYLGDFVTTDHISPAGVIPGDGPAAAYLREHGVEKADWNSFGARRGNDRIMVRGTFGNIRLKNKLVSPKEGGWTRYLPTGETLSVYEAAQKYRDDGVPLVVLAGQMYGAGSSRDWAAKGTFLLGVKAVVAESFERIHRSNLIGMGVLPLQYREGESAATYGLSGEEVFSLPDLSDAIRPGSMITLRAESSGTAKEIPLVARIDTPIEVDYYRHGGILNYVLRDFMAKA